MLLTSAKSLDKTSSWHSAVIQLLNPNSADSQLTVTNQQCCSCSVLQLAKQQFAHLATFTPVAVVMQLQVNMFA
jgi:hypothetical protein